LSEYKGKHYLNIREWYTKDRQQWFPSNKGIAFEHKDVPQLTTLVEKAEEEILNGQDKGAVSQ
jgi:hypothetical protein